MPQVFLLLIIGIFNTAVAQLCFKKGVLKLGQLNFSFSEVGFLISQIFQNIWLILGILLFGISFLLWLFILSKINLNVAYPITLSCQMVLITVGTWFLFKEYLSFFQILGIAFIVLGIFLLLTKDKFLCENSITKRIIRLFNYNH